MKVYYDTSALAYFFFTKDAKNEFSPFSEKIEGIISAWVIEEFLHVIAMGKCENWSKKSFLEIYKDFQAFLSLVKETNFDTIAARLKFSEILNVIVKHLEKDFETKYRKSEAIHFKDIFHLSIAETCECEALVTMDKGFKIIEEIKEKLHFDFLKEIVILSKDGEIEEKIYL